MSSKSYRKKKRKRKKARKLWHKACINKWENKCIFKETEYAAKGCNGITDSCHHFFPKSGYSHIEFDVDNGVPLCWPCHYLLENRPAPTKTEFIINWMGKERYESLKSKAKKRPNASFKSLGWYEKNIEKLQ